MRQNSTALMLGIMTLLLLGFSSAVLTLSENSVTLEQNATGFVFNITSNESETLNFTIDTITDTSGNSINFLVNGGNNLIINNETKTIPVSVSVADDFDFGYSVYSTNLIANGNVSGSKTLIVSFEKSNYECDGDCNEDYLSLDDFAFDVDAGIGDEDDGFYPLDTLYFELNIENDGSSDVQDISVSICVYDINNEKCIFDEDDFDLSDEEFDLDENDDLDLTGTLYLDASELEEGNNDYRLLITFEGKVDDSDDPLDGEYTYAFSDEEFNIYTDDEFVIVTDIEVSTPYISCGDSIIITAHVWNVWDEDFDDDEVYVNVWSNDLNFDEIISFEDGIESMDYEFLTYSFELPDGLEEGKYYEIHMDVYEKDTIADKYLYENSLEDTAEYSFLLMIDNCGEEPTISANYVEGTATSVGRKMEIVVDVSNEGDSAENYKVGVSDYSSWAEVLSISPIEQNIAAGDTEEYLVVFRVKEAGSQGFNIDVTSEDGTVTSQKVNVEVAEGFFGNLNENTTTYIIVGALGLLIIILLIAIIVASSKKKRRAVMAH